MNCETCAYSTTKHISKCEIFTQKPAKCWAYATPEEKAKRETAIKQYKELRGARK